MMMERAIHRRVSFWLGLFVALFLAWAWWRSMEFHLLLTWRLGNTTMGGMRYEGATHLFYGIPAPVGIWHVPGSYLELMGVKRLLDLDGYFYPYRYNGMESGHVKVPDGLVFFGYLWLWGWWLVRRGRVGREKGC